MDDAPRTVSSRPSSTATPLTKLIAGIILLLLVAVGGFMGGISYQKGHTKTATSAATSGGGFGGQGGFGGGAGARRSGGRGQVTAVSGTSITINNQRTGGSQTFTITSSTKITDNGSTVTASDIKTGDDVFVLTSSSTSTDATQILVNPSLGGGAGGQSTNTPSSDGSNSSGTSI